MLVWSHLIKHLRHKVYISLNQYLIASQYLACNEMEKLPDNKSSIYFTYARSSKHSSYRFQLFDNLINSLQHILLKWWRAVTQSGQLQEVLQVRKRPTQRPGLPWIPHVRTPYPYHFKSYCTNSIFTPHPHVGASCIRNILNPLLRTPYPCHTQSSCRNSLHPQCPQSSCKNSLYPWLPSFRFDPVLKICNWPDNVICLVKPKQVKNQPKHNLGDINEPLNLCSSW